MKRLYVFLLRAYIGPMVMTFFIVMFILLMQFLWRYIDDLVGKGMDFTLVAELLLYASVGLIPMALPLATMLAVLMTMGNLGEHNELLAMKSAGISLPRIIFPLGVVSLLVTLFAYGVADYLVPVSTLKMRTLIYSLQQQRPDLVIRPGVFYNDIAGYSLRIGSRDKDGRMMRDLMIYDHSAGRGNVSVTRADSGLITVSPDSKYLVVELYSGTRYDETDPDAVTSSNAKRGARTTHFRRERLVKRLEGFGFERSNEDVFSNTYHVMNTWQLRRAVDSISGRQDSMIGAEHLRFAEEFFYRKPFIDTVTHREVCDTFRLLTHYAGLDTTQRKQVLMGAIEDAQRIKSHVSSYNDDLSYEAKMVAKHLIEFFRKYSMSLAVLIFFLIGAPLGAIIRKGGLGMPVVVSVLFFVVYYVISITGEKMVRQLATEAWVGMWVSTFILIPLAVFLLYKATTDSVLLNRDWYARSVRRWLRVHKKLLRLLHKRRAARADETAAEGSLRDR